MNKNIMKTSRSLVVEFEETIKFTIDFQGANTYLLWEENDGTTFEGLAVCGFEDLARYNQRKGVMEALADLVERSSIIPGVDEDKFSKESLSRIRTFLSKFVSDEKINLIAAHSQYQLVEAGLDFQNSMVGVLSDNCQYFKTDGERKNRALLDLMIENLKLKYGIREFPDNV